MSKIKVDLKERSYDIMVGANTLPELGSIIEKNKWDKDVFIITDPVVNDLYGDQLRQGLKSLKHCTLEVPRGESNKCLRSAATLYTKLVKKSAHRDSLIVALGGGVIGDLAGFVAATYMRGVDYIQVPTTLLAQVDAAIGGKTGVNHPRCKNMIGAFYQPKLVFSDVKTLTTLPAREIRTGLAEVVKYGIIYDADFFKFLEANSKHLNTKAFGAPDTLRAALKVWQIIVTESAKIKARVVKEDEREGGLRMILNFGHTVGHTLESLTQYKTFNHGEAVAVGMVAAAKIANRTTNFSLESVNRLVELLEKLGLPTKVNGLPIKKVLKALEVDKKVLAGKLKFVLPEKIGKVVIKDDLSLAEIKKALKEIGCK